jgi:O-antigen ligase
VIVAATTAGHALLRLGLLVDAGFAAAALVSRGRPRRIAVGGALLLSPVLLAAALWKSTQVLHLRHHPALAVAGIVVALALVAMLAPAARRRPAAVALAAVVALPFRFSIISGGTGGVLLLLYAVIAAGAVALAVWDDPGEEPAIGWLERALAAFVVIYALQALYTPDPARAAESICFFYAPFALLFVLLRRVRWERALIARAAAVVLALVAVFVAVALVEYAARRLLFHPALNANQRYFRVNSLFYDPNIFGRFVALAMVGVAAAMMWESSRRRVLLAAVVLALLWLGLAVSVSQSSVVALLAGVAVIAAARFPPRLVAAAVVLVLALVAVVAVADRGSLHLNLSDTSAANNTTGGRASLVKEGLNLFAARPLQGFGSASFSCEYLRHSRGTHAYACGSATPAGVTSESHTTPVTIAAEQGVIGLLAYLALLLAAAATLARGGLRHRPVRVALLAAFVALVVHTWAYADFLEDPITWALLAVGAVLARERPTARADRAP